jgi:hypothetical protein
LIWRLSGGWLVDSLSAALPKCNSSANTQKANKVRPSNLIISDLVMNIAKNGIGHALMCTLPFAPPWIMNLLNCGNGIRKNRYENQAGP